MPQLRHIILLIPLPPRIDGSIHVLENLQTVSTVANFKLSGEGIAMIPNVKKLKLVHSSREWSELGLTKFPDPIPMYYALATSIRRLSLVGCRPPLEDMSIIGSLPHLELLKPKIFNFSRLEHLIVKCCWNLEEDPWEFGDIATLKVNDIEACSQFVANSALAIQEEQENMGNELLV